MTVTNKPSRTTSPGYMIQLDSLRALAVFGVMFEHYVPSGSSGSILFYWKPLLDLGISAVTLFLVLSGFLITGILLRARDTINPTTQSARFTIWIFYIRRFLRISPIYYLTLIAHRLSTIVRADKVVVLDQGRIVEQGGYQELLEQRSYLWKYHQLQS